MKTIALTEVPALANPLAEQCAHDIANALPDMEAAQAIYTELLAALPLKRWEASALQARAIFLAKNKA